MLPDGGYLLGWLALSGTLTTILLSAYLRALGRCAHERKLREHAERNREDDRTGRIKAEKALRSLARQGLSSNDGENSSLVTLKPIGVLQSCFKGRNGTPRQAYLVPTSRAVLRLRPDLPGKDALDGLEGFSHCWLIFVFHENTNAARNLKFADGKQPIKAKVAPPRLNGMKLGLFATRTPHRPNPVGLSLARIMRIEGDTIHLAGIDLIDGTPILDIKPYIPHCDNVSNQQVKVPSWVDAPHESTAWSRVVIPEEVAAQLHSLCVLDDALEFYHGEQDFGDLRCAIEQLLMFDVRSLHKRQTTSPQPEALRTSSSILDSHRVVFDRLELSFEIVQEPSECYVRVSDVQLVLKEQSPPPHEPE